MQYLEELNSAQRQAAEAGDGPLCIIAGPGTGKTKTLAARIAWLVAAGRAQPAQILALTFTKKAAEEMQARLQRLLANSSAAAAGSPQIATFHALCSQILGGERQFISEPARLQLVKQLKKSAQLKGVSARELALKISRAKNLAEDDPAILALCTAYNRALAEKNLQDFDDLLLQTKALLEQDASARAKIQARYRYILVDEFQDTNRLQYELLHLLRGNENLFVIGDPQQSIYGFRGASGNIFGQFAADFPHARSISLTQNYRSAPAILNVANRIFPHAPQLEAANNSAGTAEITEVLNEYSEAAWVVGEIQRAIGGSDFLHAASNDPAASHASLKDFAILYRSRACARAVQRAVAESGLPYQIVGDGSPYDEPHIQTLIALLQAFVSGQPPEEFSAAEWAKITAFMGEQAAAPPAELLENLADFLGFEPSPALRQFTGTLVRFKTAPAAAAHLATLATQDFYDPRAEAITLCTIHASKGLEFPRVFLIAAEDGLLPSATGEPEEERRLFYVAATRAQTHLHILHAQKRAGQAAQLSHFARAIPPQILPRITDANLPADRRRLQTRAAKRSQQALF